MSLSVGGLKSLLLSNVVEIKFTRRRQNRRVPTRRMLATLNYTLLNSEMGKAIFRFTEPTNSPPFNANLYNLVTAYDLFMLDWRNIPADSSQIVNVIPAEPDVEFWEYFDKVLSKMSATQKAAFMDK